MTPILKYGWERVVVLCCLLLVGCTSAEIQANKPLNEGKQLAFTRSKGNCLACHAIDDGELAGNIAPELKNISQRFKTKLELKHFIWDATVFNSETVMPPFGKNKILSESEIDKIVDYLWQL